jgi:predicted acetyltransferase
VPSSSRWIEEEGRLVGFIALRHELNDYLLDQGGHIGYAVRPSARGRGLATAATALVLRECRRRGIDPVLITCDDDNAASATVIERNGGVLEDVRRGKRRYWVTVGA